MSLHPLLELLENLLSKVAERQGLSLRGQNRSHRYYLLRSTEFGRRRERWFPSDPIVEVRSPMPRDQFDQIRTALALARGFDGEVCLSRDELCKLDEAYLDYERSNGSPGSDRANEYIHKRFDALARQLSVGKAQLHDPKIFRKFLADTVLAPLWIGDLKVSKRNRDAIRSALQNKSPYFPESVDARVQLDDILLDVCAFCSLLEGDGVINRYSSILARRQTKGICAFRRQALLQLAHFQDPKKASAAVSLEDLLDGKAGLYGELEGPYMMIRAACSAIESGADLREAPRSLRGHSVDSLFTRGLETLGAIATHQSRLNCRAFSLRAHALRGRLDEVLRGAMEIRLDAGKDGTGPHLEAMLLINEGIAFGKAARGDDNGYLWAAHGKLADLKKLANNASLATFWEFDLAHMREINRSCVDKLRVKGHFAI